MAESAPFRLAAFTALLLIAASLSCSGQAGERPAATYDAKTGRLRALAFDANKNGKNDSVVYMDGIQLQRIELDLDENGRVERWDFYDADRKLEKVGLSQRNDGVMDAEAFYTEAGVMTRMLISTKRNGHYDRTEHYDNSVLSRSEDDTNDDGKPDKWDTYRSDSSSTQGAAPYVITSTAVDEAGSGKPTRRFVFGDQGVVSRVEVDPDGDGVFIPLETDKHGVFVRSQREP